MDSQQEIVQLLKEELAKSQLKNSAYSLRALAKKLKSSPSTLSEILNGRRPITKGTAEKLLVGLCLPEDQSMRLLSGLPIRYTKKAMQRYNYRKVKEYVEVDMKQFDAIANWYYFGILSLAETTTFKSDPAWIASRFGIKVADAKKAIQTLVALKLLRQTKSGKLSVTGQQFVTSGDISDVSIRRSHFQNLDVLKLSLENDPVKDRDFSHATMTFDPSEMAMAKNLIKEFRRGFTHEIEKTKKKEVYRLSVQFVSLSKKEASL